MDQAPASPPEPPPPPAEEPAPADQPQGPQKLTAPEAAKKYGVRCAIILAVLCWFAYDGWFNPKYQAEDRHGDMWFNRIGAYVLGVAFLYHGVMFGSAALTVRRQQGQPDDQSPAAPPSPPTS
ncbi:hypothetical protein HQ590_08285 [bacterium]|nr:hypothetical protein [bacterium]